MKIFYGKNRQQMALLDPMESAWLMNFRGKLRAFDVFFFFTNLFSRVTDGAALHCLPDRS